MVASCYLLPKELQTQWKIVSYPSSIHLASLISHGVVVVADGSLYPGE